MENLEKNLTYLTPACMTCPDWIERAKLVFVRGSSLSGRKREMQAVALCEHAVVLTF